MARLAHEIGDFVCLALLTDPVRGFMFQFLGRISSRRAITVVVTWIVVLAIALLMAPPWAQVAENGEFAFLPPEAPSRVAEEKFTEAFDDTLASNVVLVVRRETSQEGLKESDRAFIREILMPGLRRIAELPEGEDSHGDSTEHRVSRLHWFGARATGELFNSEDGQATLIILQLTTEFLDQGNAPLIEQV